MNPLRMVVYSDRKYIKRDNIAIIPFNKLLFHNYSNIITKYYIDISFKYFIERFLAMFSNKL